MAAHKLTGNKALLDDVLLKELYADFVGECDAEDEEADKKQFYVALAMWETEKQFNPNIQLFRFSWLTKSSRALYSTGLLSSALNVACLSAYQLPMPDGKYLDPQVSADKPKWMLLVLDKCKYRLALNNSLAGESVEH